MNEEHVIAAILTVGLITQNKDVELQPKDAVGIYQLTLAELLQTIRPQRGTEGNEPS